MQSACIGSLMELAEADKNVLYITADSGEGGLDLIFRQNFPEQSLDFGIAEAAAIGAAAGLAMSGKRPFIYDASPFLIYRGYEFIRDDICLQGQRVTLIGYGSGMSVSALGPTHHTTEDIALLCGLPNMTVFSPATPKQAGECVKAAYKAAEPAYIRIGANREKEYFDGGEYRTGDGFDIMKNGADVWLISTGAVLSEVMDAVELLAEKGHSVGVINVWKLKPFPIEGLREMLGSARLLVTIEEHNVKGGLGSIVAENLSEICGGGRAVPRLLRIGLPDTFAAGYGTHADVLAANGLDAAAIAARVGSFIGDNL